VSEQRQRLEELDEEIRDARRKAEEAIHGFGADEPEKFAESGSARPDDDDQTTAPG